MSELYYAEMEAARNEAEKTYFDARPQINANDDCRALFRAGFERGFQKLWNERAVTRSIGAPMLLTHEQLHPSLDLLKRVRGRLKDRGDEASEIIAWAVDQLEEHDQSFELRWKPASEPSNDGKKRTPAMIWCGPIMPIYVSG